MINVSLNRAVVAIVALVITCVLYVCQGSLAAQELPVRLSSLERYRPSAEQAWGQFRSDTQFDDQLLHGSHPLLLEKLKDIARTLEPLPVEVLNQLRESLHERLVEYKKQSKEWSNGKKWVKYLSIDELLSLIDPELRLEKETSDLSETSITAGGKPLLETISALKTIIGKFENIETNPEYSSVSDKTVFVQSSGQLKQYTAELSCLNSEYQDLARKRLSELAQVILTSESDRTPADIRALRRNISELSRSSLPEQKALAETMNAAFFSPNLNVVITPILLKRFSGTTRQMRGPVQEELSGAVITGTQVTRTFPSVQILPSEHSAMFTVLLNGVCDSLTTAKKSPATIFGKCHSEFIARKQIELTEAGLLVAEPTEVEVLTAKMEYTGAEVDVPGFLKKIARRTALRKAAEKRPAAEALTRKRILERVSAQLDHEVNTTLKQVNERYYWLWETLLKNESLAVTTVATFSNDQSLFVSGTFLSEGQLAGNVAPAVSAESLAVIQVHESALNNAFDQLKLEGRTVAANELKTGMITVLRENLGVIVDFKNSREDTQVSGSITFAAKDPLRVRFIDGKIQLVSHASSFQQGSVKVPGKIMRINYVPQIEDDHIVFLRNGPIAIEDPQVTTETTVAAVALGGLLGGANAAFEALLRIALDQFFVQKLSLPRSSVLQTEMTKDVKLEFGEATIKKKWLVLNVY